MEGVSKSFGPIVALKDVSLSVPYGVVIALLGPNGAGKTTLVRILTTLLKADAGRAKVAGFDVERQGAALRAHIGLAGQFAAVDRNLTGRENLEMVGRLYHLSGAESGRRADELLERFGLSESAHRLCRTYSGGMLAAWTWPPAWWLGLRCCFWTNPRLDSTPGAVSPSGM